MTYTVYYCSFKVGEAVYSRCFATESERDTFARGKKSVQTWSKVCYRDDVEKPVGQKCAFSQFKTCDGLCNNCGLNIRVDPNNPYPAPARRGQSYGDYEGRILARQESCYD